MSRQALPEWHQQWIDCSETVRTRRVFFIGGCQKSGTTWLQHLLNAHPGVCCGGEGHLLDLLTNLLKQAINAYNERQLQRNELHRVLLQRKDLLGMARSAGDRLFARYLEACEDPRSIIAIGDKTPEHALAFGLLDELYPRGRFIHIVRDGRDAAVSGWFHLQRQGGGDRFGSFAAYAAYFAEHHWVPYITAARQAGASLGVRYCEVRYEDLQSWAGDELSRVLDWLEIEASEAEIAHCVESASFRRVSGGRDPGEVDDASFFRRGVSGGWKEHFDEAALGAFLRPAGPLLAQLGYGEDPVKRQAARGPVGDVNNARFASGRAGDKVTR